MVVIAKHRVLLSTKVLYIHELTQFLQHKEIDTITIPTLLIRKLRHRAAEQIAKAQRATLRFKTTSSDTALNYSL